MLCSTDFTCQSVSGWPEGFRSSSWEFQQTEATYFFLILALANNRSEVGAYCLSLPALACTNAILGVAATFLPAPAARTLTLSRSPKGPYQYLYRISASGVSIVHCMLVSA